MDGTYWKSVVEPWFTPLDKLNLTGDELAILNGKIQADVLKGKQVWTAGRPTWKPNPKDENTQSVLREIVVFVRWPHCQDLDRGMSPRSSVLSAEHLVTDVRGRAIVLDGACLVVVGPQVHWVPYDQIVRIEALTY